MTNLEDAVRTKGKHWKQTERSDSFVHWRRWLVIFGPRVYLRRAATRPQSRSLGAARDRERASDVPQQLINTLALHAGTTEEEERTKTASVSNPFNKEMKKKKKMKRERKLFQFFQFQTH